MLKPDNLISKVDFGDYKIITEIYNLRHSKSDGDNITPSYVRRVLTGERTASPGTAAEEIIRISRIYLTRKEKTKELLIMT